MRRDSIFLKLHQGTDGLVRLLREDFSDANKRDLPSPELQDAIIKIEALMVTEGIPVVVLSDPPKMEVADG